MPSGFLFHLLYNEVFMSGFEFVKSQGQGETSGKLTQFYVDAAHTTLLGPGDVVRITGTSTTAGKSAVDTGVDNTGNTGVIASILPLFTTEALSTTWVPALTAATVLVNTDTFALYEAGVANGPLAAADVGLNVPLVTTEGTVSGSLFTSNMQVNATGKATTNTLPFQVVELLEDADGILGNRALVRMNATTATYGATGI
jgi:hypothetical protein